MGKTVIFNRLSKLYTIIESFKKPSSNYKCELLDGIEIIKTFIPSLYSIYIDDNNHLIISYDVEEYDNMYINESGHLIATYIEKESGIMSTVDLGQVVPQITAGTTTTGAAGSSASVTITGTTTAPIINMTVPRGNAGVDGTSTYTWVKYATSSAGAGLSDSPTGMTYIGFAFNKSTATESTVAGDYTWSQIKGTDGLNGVTPTLSIDASGHLIATYA